MKFLKGSKLHKVLDIFIILGWVFILCDSTHRVIAGPHTNLWLDIFFIALAIVLLPIFVTEYLKRHIRKETTNEEEGNGIEFHFKSNLKLKDIALAIALPLLLIGAVILFNLFVK